MSARGPAAERRSRVGPGWLLVVIIGRPEHVEVLGLTEDLDSFVVVPSLAGVGRYEAARIGVVAQTTFPSAEAAAIRQQIARANPSARIEWVDTICQPTKDRQQALQDLLARVQAVVVVGGAQIRTIRGGWSKPAGSAPLRCLRWRGPQTSTRPGSQA